MVIYLTPGAPRRSGTGLYRHRATGVWRVPPSDEARRLGLSRAAIVQRLDGDSGDRRKWEELSTVDNVYNRAVVFPADWYHSSVQDFGGRPENAKLYQAFFFHGTPNPFAPGPGIRQEHLVATNTADSGRTWSGESEACRSNSGQ